jgi:bifunctional non-homologous end joining protein LigD
VRVEISKPDKVLFAEAGVSKRDLAAYYKRVAKPMLAHIKGRPISMQRFPDGVEKQGFFHKEIPDYFPDWIERVQVRTKDGAVTHAVARNADTLVYLADQACVTPHVWLSRVGNLQRPDRMVFDLDPSGGSFSEVRHAAEAVGGVLEQLGLAAYAMATGSRGLHVWVPLRPRADFDEVRRFARDVAELLVRQSPDRLTLETRKAQRAGRILIDVMRNAYAQTAVPPYAVRAKPSASVAMPLHWRELSDHRLRPDKFTTRNIERRLSGPDPWAGMARRARRLDAPRRRLNRLLAEE